MCGIFGHITPGGSIDPVACYEAVQTLAHRGPDGLGIALGRLGQRTVDFHLNPPRQWIERQTTAGCDFLLGHRRLAILDLTAEAFQPMPNEDRTVWVVFNGEIYNHQELRCRLEACGHRFRTDHADTEVLVHGYEQWGDHLVDQLRGMFALAVLDLRANRVFLARDRFGEKPLYYSASRAGLMFASELKALVRLPALDRSICSAALVDYLNHGLVPAPRSILQNVKKLRAAEKATIDLEHPESVAAEIYWQPRYEPVAGKSEAQWAEEFEDELSRSIRLRMLSDVPLGAFLSGGLDSTVVTREMSLASSRPVRTFSIGFDDRRFDESPYARQAAEKYHTLHRAEVLSPAGLLEAVPTVAAIFDEPLADSSAIPTYLVSRLARQDVTVALSGDGGDELLAGYRRYRLQQRLARWLDPQPAFLVKMIFEPLSALWPQRARGRALLDLLVPGAKARYFKVFLDDYLVNMADDRLTQQWDCLLEPAWSEQTPGLVDRMCATDCRFYLPEDLMVKVDRTSMSVSLETRCPLLDHKLFELVGRMPAAMRFDGKTSKRLLRKILARDLGQAFVDRPKKGFSIPLGSWFRRELYGDLSDTLLRSGGLVTSLLSGAAVRRLIEEHRTGGRDQSRRLWKLYMLEKWHDCFGTRMSPPAAAAHV